MAKIEFKRDPKTGKLIVYKNGKRHGEMTTMGDQVKKGPEKRTGGKQNGKR